MAENMFISKITINAFKSFINLTLQDQFSPGANLICGLNGQGKSNLLKAIGYLSDRNFESLTDLEKKSYLCANVQQKHFYVQVGMKNRKTQALQHLQGGLPECTIRRGYKLQTKKSIFQINGSIVSDYQYFYFLQNNGFFISEAIQQYFLRPTRQLADIKTSKILRMLQQAYGCRNFNLRFEKMRQNIQSILATKQKLIEKNKQITYHCEKLKQVQDHLALQNRRKKKINQLKQVLIAKDIDDTKQKISTAEEQIEQLKKRIKDWDETLAKLKQYHLIFECEKLNRVRVKTELQLMGNSSAQAIKQIKEIELLSSQQQREDKLEMLSESVFICAQKQIESSIKQAERQIEEIQKVIETSQKNFKKGEERLEEYDQQLNQYCNTGEKLAKKVQSTQNKITELKNKLIENEIAKNQVPMQKLNDDYKKQQEFYQSLIDQSKDNQVQKSEKQEIQKQLNQQVQVSKRRLQQFELQIKDKTTYRNTLALQRQNLINSNKALEAESSKLQAVLNSQNFVSHSRQFNQSRTLMKVIRQNKIPGVYGMLVQNLELESKHFQLAERIMGQKLLFSIVAQNGVQLIKTLRELDPNYSKIGVSILDLSLCAMINTQKQRSNKIIQAERELNCTKLTELIKVKGLDAKISQQQQSSQEFQQFSQLKYFSPQSQIQINNAKLTKLQSGSISLLPKDHRKMLQKFLIHRFKHYIIAPNIDYALSYSQKIRVNCVVENTFEVIRDYGSQMLSGLTQQTVKSNMRYYQFFKSAEKIDRNSSLIVAQSQIIKIFGREIQASEIQKKVIVEQMSKQQQKIMLLTEQINQNEKSVEALMWRRNQLQSQLKDLKFKIENSKSRLVKANKGKGKKLNEKQIAKIKTELQAEENQIVKFVEKQEQNKKCITSKRKDLEAVNLDVLKFYKSQIEKNLVILDGKKNRIEVLIDDQRLISEYKEKFIEKHKLIKQKVSLLFSAENSTIVQDDFTQSAEFKQKFDYQLKKEKQKVLNKKKKLTKSIEASMQSKIMSKIRQQHSFAEKSNQIQQNMISTTLNFTNTLVQDDDEQKLLKNIDDKILVTILDKIKKCEFLLEQKRSTRIAQAHQMQDENLQNKRKIEQLLNTNPIQIIKYLKLLNKNEKQIVKILNLKGNDNQKKWMRQITLKQGIAIKISEQSFPDLESQIDSFGNALKQFQEQNPQQINKLIENCQNIIDTEQDNFQRDTQHFYENQTIDNLKQLQNLSELYQQQEFVMIQNEASQSIKLINEQRKRCIIRGFQRINNLLRQFVKFFQPNMTLEIKVVSMNKEGEVVKDSAIQDIREDEQSNSFISEEIVDAMLRDYSSEVLDEYLEQQAQINVSKSGSGAGILKFKKNITNELKNQLSDLIKNRKNIQRQNVAENSYKFQIQLGKVNHTQEQGQSMSSSVQSVLSKNSVELLSGGQKSIIGLSVFAAFSMLDSQNQRILLFDQADASLDLKYRMGFSQLIDKLKEETQLFVVSFRKEIIDSIDHFYEVRYFQRVSFAKEVNKKGAMKVIAQSSSNESQDGQQEGLKGNNNLFSESSNLQL